MALSWGLRAALTVAFAVTGGYCLLRCAAPGLLHPAHPLGVRVADASHLVMSAAMIAMLWSWNPPDRWGGQLALFAAFAGWYLIRATDTRRARGARVALAHQGVAMAAMFWMLFPATPATASAAMPGMDMPGMEMSATGGQPAGLWSAGHLVTLALAGSLAVAVVWWLRAAVTAPAPAGGGLRVVFGPVGAASCQAVMAAGMCVVLIASV